MNLIIRPSLFDILAAGGRTFTAESVAAVRNVSVHENRTYEAKKHHPIQRLRSEMQLLWDVRILMMRINNGILKT